MAEPRSEAEEAGDSSTSPERLVDLTEKRPQLHRLIVLNPSCPDVARQWILATNPWAKQAYEASLAEDAGETAASPADEEAEDGEAVSVWGDLGTSTGAAAGAAASADTAPQEIPRETPTAPVRIAQDAGVVPLGASPAEPTPAPAAAAAFSAAGPSADRGDPRPAEDDGSSTRRRTWYACGGCLLLALLLLVVTALVARAWLTDDQEGYQRDSSTTAAQGAPAEEAAEEPTEATSSPDPVSPAPEDAREMTALRSPTGNIACRLEEDTVSCSVLEYDFEDSGQEGCEAGPFSIRVADEEAARACGSSSLADSADTLEYDDSAAYGHMACTSRFDGMTCWNTITGKGFMVNRATYETF